MYLDYRQNLTCTETSINEVMLIVLPPVAISVLQYQERKHKLNIKQ